MRMRRKVKRWILIGTIFAVGGGGAVLLGQMKPPPEKKEATDVEILVDVLPLEASTVSFSIQSQGNVRPRTETVLSAEVSGSIVGISPKFVAGGVFRKGEELLRIDPTNYVAAVDQAQAVLLQRQIEYDGAVKLKDKGFRADAEMASAAAALATAKADLTRARRSLERTRIRLPYAGMVRSKEADLGQYVNIGSRLGVTFATDYAEVRLPLTDQDLAFIQLPAAADVSDSGEDSGPLVELSAMQRGRPATWGARITRSEGVVDETTRVTYAVARVEDPYQLSSGASNLPLPMGTFVRARIDGATVENVIRVPRAALRGSDQLVFVDSENRVQIRPVDVLRADAGFAYIQGGAESGERISLTPIESPVNGMKVRTSDDPVEPEDDGPAAERLAEGGE